MKFSFVSTAILALPILASASAIERRTGGSQCTTGSLECCQSTQSVTDASGSLLGLLSLLGVVVGDLTGLIGSTCSPITVVGTGTTSCSEQPVCCTNNSFNGVVALGCSPINLSA